MKYPGLLTDSNAYPLPNPKVGLEIKNEESALNDGTSLAGWQ